MGEVYTLLATEPSAIDIDMLNHLKATVGEKRCRGIVDGIVFEISDLLCQVERAAGREDFDVLPSLLTRLRTLAAQVGLVCMTDVASDLSECAESYDRVAVASVTARLIRLGEDSLFALIEYADRSTL